MPRPAGARRAGLRAAQSRRFGLWWLGLRRLWRPRLAAALLVAAGLLVARRGVALAHAALVRAEPAAGSTLAAVPRRVRLQFSEPVDAPLAAVALVDGAGRSTALVTAADPRDVNAVVAAVAGPLAPGAYRVVWRVVSADGHAVRGSYVFTLAPPRAAGTPNASGVPGAPNASAAPPPAPPPDPAGEAVAWGPAVLGAPLVPAVLRGLALGVLMLLAGVLAFAVWPAGRGDPGARLTADLAPPAGVIGPLALGAPLLLLLHAAAWLANVAPDHRLSADAVSAALAGGAGRAEAWRTGLAGLALWAVALARRPGLGLAFAAAALAASGAVGHPAVLYPWAAVPAKALHLLAGAVWAGGLVWLAHAARARQAGRIDGAALLGAWDRVSGAALVAAGLAAVTGVLQAALFLPTPADLARSAYGGVTLAKTAGFAALVAFGAYQRRRVRPALAAALAAGPAAPLRPALRREGAVMALVVLLGGLLAYVPPPNPPPNASSGALPNARPGAGALTSTDGHP